jgi:hypothetical protein
MGDIAQLLEARAMVLPPPARPGMPIWPFANIGGRDYPIQTLLGEIEEISPGYRGYVEGMFKANPIVFACEMARINLFTEARFMWRRLDSGRPGDLFGSRELAPLERPWPKATTGDLLGRMLVHADFGGNSFVVRRSSKTLRPLRPDWITVILGSELDPEMAAWDVDADMIGIAYQPGGPSGGQQPQVFLAEEFAHFVSTPDPLAPAGLGMPWVQTIIREVLGDNAATAHKLAFFRNGATPNAIVTVDKGYTDDQILGLRKQIESRHEGVRNAYRTLILRAAVEKLEVVGKDLQQLDFKVVQGAGETRIAAAAGVPAAVVGISEGLQGSGLSADTYTPSMRRFADQTMRPKWRNVCGSLEAIVSKPAGGACLLWYDDRDVPALKDDIKDAAEVLGLQSTAIATLTRDGYAAASVVDAVTSGDLRRLKHTGQFSVQLRPPGGKEPPQPDMPMNPGDMTPPTNGEPMPTGGAK